MKNLLYLLIFLYTPCFGQSLYDLMTEDELFIGSIYSGFSVGNNSFWFCDESTKCGASTFTYYTNTSSNNGTRNFFEMTIEDEKVYLVRDDCTTFLLYDYSINVGDTIQSGLFQSFVVDSISTAQMLDGTTRPQYFLHGGCINTSWIYGIGDVKFGFNPIFNIEVSSRYMCTKIGGFTLHQSDANSSTGTYNCESISCFRPEVNFEVNISSESTVSPLVESICSTPSMIWDFGDNNYSEEYAPVHNYSNPGCYEILAGAFYECSEDTVYQRKLANICTNDAWEKEYGFEISEMKTRSLDENIEFAFDQLNMYKSLDAGQTWINFELPQPDTGIALRVITDIQFYDQLKGIMTNSYYNVSNSIPRDNIFYTEDGGETWRRSENSRNYPWTLELGENGYAWSTNATGKYLISNDYGKSWAEIDDSFDAWSDVFHYINSNLLFRISRKADFYYQGFSGDNGQNWEFILLDFIPVKAEYLNRFQAFALAKEGFYYTNDGGSTWTQVDLPFIVQDFAFYSNDIGWIQTDLGAIYYSNDGFNTFEITYCGDKQVRNIVAINDKQAQAIKAEQKNQNGTSTPYESKISFNINLVGEADCLINSNEVITSESILLYPNPANNQLTIEYSDSIDFKLEIYSYDGVKRIEINNQSIVDIRSLTSGIYFLKFIDFTNNNSIVEKFTKY